MSSKFDQDLIAMKKEWAEEERKKMQEAFDSFHKSKEWSMICMIYEAGDCFDIVIREVREKRSYLRYLHYLHGRGWEKSYLTPEQLKSVQEKQQELEQEKKEVLPEKQSENTYKWGIICQDTGLHMDGEITAHSPHIAAGGALELECGNHCFLLKNTTGYEFYGIWQHGCGITWNPRITGGVLCAVS